MEYWLRFTKGQTALLLIVVTILILAVLASLVTVIFLRAEVQYQNGLIELKDSQLEYYRGREQKSPKTEDGSLDGNLIFHGSFHASN